MNCLVLMEEWARAVVTRFQDPLTHFRSLRMLSIILFKCSQASQAVYQYLVPIFLP